MYSALHDTQPVSIIEVNTDIHRLDYRIEPVHDEAKDGRERDYPFRQLDDRTFLLSP